MDNANMVSLIYIAVWNMIYIDMLIIDIDIINIHYYLYV